MKNYYWALHKISNYLPQATRYLKTILSLLLHNLLKIFFGFKLVRRSFLKRGGFGQTWFEYSLIPRWESWAVRCTVDIRSWYWNQYFTARTKTQVYDKTHNFLYLLEVDIYFLNSFFLFYQQFIVCFGVQIESLI